MHSHEQTVCAVIATVASHQRFESSPGGQGLTFDRVQSLDAPGPVDLQNRVKMKECALIDDVRL
jgi:hypothetical protein